MRYSRPTIFYKLAVGYFLGVLVEVRIACTWRPGVLNCLSLHSILWSVQGGPKM